MYKISKEEIAIEPARSFSVLEVISGILIASLLLCVAYRIVFFAGLITFGEPSKSIEQLTRVVGYVFLWSIAGLLVAGILIFISWLFNSGHTEYTGIPDMSNLKLVRVEAGPWGTKYVYESDREL